MQELTLTEVSLFKTKKDGQPYVGKFGAYYILKVRCDQYPEPISFFINPGSEHENLKVGDTVLAEVDVPKEYNGFFSRSGKLANPKDVKQERMANALKNLLKWAETQGFNPNKIY